MNILMRFRIKTNQTIARFETENLEFKKMGKWKDLYLPHREWIWEGKNSLSQRCSWSWSDSVVQDHLWSCSKFFLSRNRRTQVSGWCWLESLTKKETKTQNDMNTTTIELKTTWDLLESEQRGWEVVEESRSRRKIVMAWFIFAILELCNNTNLSLFLSQPQEIQGYIYIHVSCLVKEVGT